MPLPDIPGGTGNTLATAVSGDGQYIVGASRNSSGTPRPVRWHNGIAEHIGLSAAGQPNTGVALDCTADGSVVVGNVIFGNAGAFIWDAAHGYRDLNAALLADYGLLTSFAKIGGISDDGLVIVGTDPGEVGLVVVLPEPTGLVAVAAALAGLLARR